MAEPQFIRTPNGEELVVLARADYDELIATVADLDEEAADGALYDQRKAELAAGPDGVLPQRVSEALLRGDSRLKAIRKWRGLTQSDLAQRAGLVQGYLSELENRQKQGGAEALESLARALDVPSAWLAGPQTSGA